MQGTLVTYLENLDGVRQVNRSEVTASSLASAAKLVGICCCSNYYHTLAVSIFPITNTIVIGITVRKDEISIMKFIGATDGFVNAPFFVEGITIGIIGSVIPLVILSYIYQKVISYVLGKFLNPQQYSCIYADVRCFQSSCTSGNMPSESAIGFPRKLLCGT